jgi:hypothetical protein
MKKKDFKNLMASISDAGRIRRGEVTASRVMEFAPVNEKDDRSVDDKSATTINEEFPVRTRYTVNDGKLVLNLESAEEGGDIVTSPLDAELITQAETLEEAFANARDAVQALEQARANR